MGFLLLIESILLSLALLIGTHFLHKVSSSVTTFTLSTTRGGGLYNSFASDGITAPVYGIGYYDLVIDNAVASRARPIDQGIVVFAARRVVDSVLTTDLGEKRRVDEAL